jgi:16S rRNA (cytosine967-C5)-methyltransferase
MTQEPRPGRGRGAAVIPARAAAFAALRRLRTSGASLNDSAVGLPELDGLSPLDRSLANELVSGTVKRRGSIDAVLGSFTRAPLRDADPDVRIVLRLTSYQLLFLDRVPAYAAVDDGVAIAARRGQKTGGFVNAVLRRVAAEGRQKLAELGAGDDAGAWATRLSYPAWLVRLLRTELGDAAAEAVMAAGNAAPERCLRANRLRGGLPAASSSLAAAGFSVAGVDGLPDALLYEGPPLERSAAFRDGIVTPQSRGSQVAGLVAAGGVADPRSRFLDLCAAPGAKTSHVAALLPDADITSVEMDPARLEELRANLARLGAESVDVVHADVLHLPLEYDGAFDAVLLDAPCSGFGTLASRADVRWRRSAADVPRLAALQKALLTRAAVAVRPGGALTYAVCTPTRAETLGVVEPLLAGGGWTADDLGAAWPGVSHPDSGGFLLVLPPADGSTAFFVARLRRTHAAAG